MENENKKTTEIPFGAKDSELYKFEYTIPEGYEARIEDGKVIVKKKESEDEHIRKQLIRVIKANRIFSSKREKKVLAWLERQKEQKEQKEQKPAEWSEEDEQGFNNVAWCLTSFYNLTNDVADRDKIDSAEIWLNHRLESLRPNHWKPSNEQMEALRRAFNTGSIEFSDMEKLATLYEDIKIEIL